MNNLVERLQARAFNMGTRHVVYDELTVNLLKEAADTLLALQTQLEAAREEEDKLEHTLKLVRMDRDHHFERAQSAVAQLERVERETIERCADVCQAHKEYMDLIGEKENGHVAAFLEHTIRALPAQTEQQKG